MKLSFLFELFPDTTCYVYPVFVSINGVRLRNKTGKKLLTYKNELQLCVDGGRGCFPYLVYLLILSVSAKRMKFIYEMRLHP